jgi:hypothetical protein
MASVADCENASLECSERSTGPYAPVPFPALQGLLRRREVPAADALREHAEDRIVSESNLPGGNRVDFAGLEAELPARRSARIYEAS